MAAAAVPVDEFTHYLASSSSTLKNNLKPVYKKKMELENEKWATVYKAKPKNKPGHVAAIRNMFGAIPDGPHPNADALATYKQFCRDNNIAITDPKVPWHQGILPPPPTQPPESMASAFSRAPGLARSIQMNTTLDTTNLDSIYKRPL